MGVVYYTNISFSYLLGTLSLYMKSKRNKKSVFSEGTTPDLKNREVEGFSGPNLTLI